LFRQLGRFLLDFGRSASVTRRGPAPESALETGRDRPRARNEPAPRHGPVRARMDMVCGAGARAAAASRSGGLVAPKHRTNGSQSMDMVVCAAITWPSIWARAKSMGRHGQRCPPPSH